MRPQPSRGRKGACALRPAAARPPTWRLKAKACWPRLSVLDTSTSSRSPRPSTCAWARRGHADKRQQGCAPDTTHGQTPALACSAPFCTRYRTPALQNLLPKLQPPPPHPTFSMLSTITFLSSATSPRTHPSVSALRCRTEGRGRRPRQVDRHAGQQPAGGPARCRPPRLRRPQRVTQRSTQHPAPSTRTPPHPPRVAGEEAQAVAQHRRELGVHLVVRVGQGGVVCVCRGSAAGEWAGCEQARGGGTRGGAGGAMHLPQHQQAPAASLHPARCSARPQPPHLVRHRARRHRPVPRREPLTHVVQKGKGQALGQRLRGSHGRVVDGRAGG